MKKPSRILNDDSMVLGLDRNDIMALAIVFFICQSFFKAIGYEYLALFATGAVTTSLISIRLSCRRKIIRDVLRYSYFKTYKGGVYHDPSKS